MGSFPILFRKQPKTTSKRNAVKQKQNTVNVYDFQANAGKFSCVNCSIIEGLPGPADWACTVIHICKFFIPFPSLSCSQMARPCANITVTASINRGELHSAGCLQLCTSEGIMEWAPKVDRVICIQHSHNIPGSSIWPVQRLIFPRFAAV